jgi:4-amino-4-deoxy-L-arabinose transferase-like glycosyltransferase
MFRGPAGVLAALMAQHPVATEAQERNWMAFAWVAMAVAVLTKGLIGIVLPGMVLVVHSLIKDWRPAACTSAPAC